MLVLNCLLTFFDVNLAAKVLGVFLVTEIVMLSLGALSRAVHTAVGRTASRSAETAQPDRRRSSPAADRGRRAPASGLFFAFWSWVGFESTAMYGEESQEPKKIIPRATMISVLGVGIFYVFISWMAIAGTGPQNAVDARAGPDDGRGHLLRPGRHHLRRRGPSTLFNILLVTGSFACGMAFHNCASRYLYAMGREGLSPGLQKTLGATHATHGSPHIASFVQTGSRW